MNAKWGKPKIIVTRKLSGDRIPEALKKVRDEAKSNGLDQITMEAIDAEIAGARSEQRNTKGQATAALHDWHSG